MSAGLGAMVSTSPAVNGASGGTKDSIPPGRYHVVGWDLDTTGRRLIDEICQIAAFSPISKFSQYVMPYRDISIGAQRRHNIRVVTIGRYRMLKDSKTGKILKTKSEISALTDFLQWLESLRGSSLDGIILINHEPFKVTAPMLLESLRRYNLLDRFSAVVKGFVNGYSVSEAKCAKTVRSFSLRTLSKMLLNKEAILDNAEDRAQLIYEIAHRLCVEDEKPDETSGGNGDCATESNNLILGSAIHKYGATLEVEEKAIEEMKVVLDRQKSLTPVFAPQLRFNLRQRQRATVLRRLLAVEGVDLATLAKNYAESGNTGIDNVLSTLTSAKSRDITDLKDMLVRYFDPSFKPSVPPQPHVNIQRPSFKPSVPPQPHVNRRRRPRTESLTETSSNATKTVSSPDASSASTSARSENNSPAKVQDIAEENSAKVADEAPKPPRKETQPTVIRQVEKHEQIPPAEHHGDESTMPEVQPPSHEPTPMPAVSQPTSPVSKPASLESKPVLPEPNTTLPASNSQLHETKPLLPESHLPELISASTDPPKISSVSGSVPLQQEQSTSGSEIKQQQTTTDSPAS